MRSSIRRYALGAILCLAGLGMLFAGASATLGYIHDASERNVPAAEAAEQTRSDGLALDARLDLDAPYSPLDPLSLHSAPELLRAAPVPGVSFDRDDLGVEQAGVGLDADIRLASGSHVEKSATKGGSVGIASMQAALGPATAPMGVAAAAFTLAGAIAYFWGSIKAGALRFAVLPAIALYAKITRAEVFDNGVRERIFGAIRANPGVSASDLARLADVSWGTTIYHLDVLEQTRMVTSLRNGRYRRYFENGATLATTKEAVAVLQNRVTAGVVDTIRTRPGATQKELAAATSMTPQALHWHLTRLVATGLVRKEREGRVVRHFTA